MNGCMSIAFKVPLLLSAQYQNYRSSSEELPYKEPSAQLDQLYDDLATMQCLEIPRKFLKFVLFLQYLLSEVQFQNNSMLFCVDLAPLLVLVSLELSVKESG